MRSRRPRLATVLGLALAALVVARPAAARPLYFNNLIGIYGFAPGDDLYACGVCHLRWEGTGARNPYGSAVEQQLYLGKPIATAILDVAGADTDGDGFTNGDELSIHGTLPGYSCSNTYLAINPPSYFQSIITPGVPSCLDPKDIRIDPAATSFVTPVGTVDTVDIGVYNNGADDPITVSSYGLLAGANPALAVSGPPLPIVIPVGQSVVLTLTFTPSTPVLAMATLRVTSDDPDEPDLDVAVTAISFANPLAPAADRAACQRDVERQMERYTKTHLREWGTCYVAELGGVACNAGTRDLRVGQAEATLRAYVGGSNDRFCAAKSLTPTRLGLPATCGGTCDAIALHTIGDLADCLVCRQQEATDAMLGESVGTVPPDVPGNVLGAGALRCNRTLIKASEKAIRKIQKSLGACRVSAITSPSPVDCSTSLAPTIATLSGRVDTQLDRCVDTTGMLGCRFAPTPDPTCLGTAATSIATDLVDAVFGTP
ncbi:MAG: hypothetical protein ACREQL_13365 [Candidatus Binatia bacterium]